MTLAWCWTVLVVWYTLRSFYSLSKSCIVASAIFDHVFAKDGVMLDVAHAHLLTEKEEKWMGPESGVVRVNVGGNITNLPVHFSQEDMVWKFYYTTKAPQEAVTGN